MAPGQGTPKKKRRRSVISDSEEEREEKRKKKDIKMDEGKENGEREWEVRLKVLCIHFGEPLRCFFAPTPRMDLESAWGGGRK